MSATDLLPRALSAADGKKLWEAPCGPGFCSPPDVLVAGGLVWTGKEFEAGRDLRTGQINKPFDVASGLWTTGHHIAVIGTKPPTGSFSQAGAASS